MSNQSQLLKKLIHIQYAILDLSDTPVEWTKEAASQYDRSTKSLRRLLKKKSWIEEEIKAKMREHGLIILKDDLPSKEKDLWSFTLPCKINDMCFDKALAELGASVSVMPYSNFTNLGFRLRDRMELDLEARLMGEALILNRSKYYKFGDFLELNDLNEPLELKNHNNEDLGPTVEKREVIDEPMVDIVEFMRNDERVEKIDEYPIAENMDAYRDKDMGYVIFRKPFCRVAVVEARRFDGFINIYNGDNCVTYRMARLHPRLQYGISSNMDTAYPVTWIRRIQ
ncbi:hypothetical protein Tco_0247980 [Tanacetum coccineum]